MLIFVFVDRFPCWRPSWTKLWVCRRGNRSCSTRSVPLVWLMSCMLPLSTSLSHLLLPTCSLYPHFCLIFCCPNVRCGACLCLFLSPVSWPTPFCAVGGVFKSSSFLLPTYRNVSQSFFSSKSATVSVDFSLSLCQLHTGLCWFRPLAFLSTLLYVSVSVYRLCVNLCVCVCVCVCVCCNDGRSHIT